MNKYLILAATIFAVLVFSPLSSAKSATAKPVAEKTLGNQKQTQTLKLNLNTAGAAEIATILTGVGMKKAEAIVEYRKAHGEFKAVEELASVKGIGVATLAKNQDRILLN